MMSLIRNVAIGATFTFAILLVADYALSIPDVYFSYSTNECTGVQTYKGVFFDSLGYSCENMPEKFNHVWVK